MSIEELLQDLNVDFLSTGHHHCRPGWVQLRRCPFCGSDNYHLGINLSGQFASCWKCGGHHINAVLAKLGARGKAKQLDRAAFVEERKRTKLKEPEHRHALEISTLHWRYLEKRGFDPLEIVRLWKVEAIGRAPRLGWRIYIPIHFRNVRVSWTTRSIGDLVPQRYVSASFEEESHNHKELVYGIDYCRHSIVIVEGPTDAWAVGPGAGALFGTAFKSAQVALLAKIPRRYVCFDSSTDAQRKAMSLVRQLSLFPGETQNILLDADDPGSASKQELKTLRKVAHLD